MNNPIYFEIQADDPKALAQFYTEVFDWKCTLDENISIEYWRIETEGIRGAILKRPAPVTSQGTNAYVISMEVTHYDSTEKKILSLGGKEALPKFAIPGKCWQGYYIDPAGNTFGIIEVDEKAAL